MANAISVRLPKDLTERLEELAAATERPKTFLVREAIESYLAEYGEYRLALDRLLDKDDEIIEGSELRRRLGL
ncbi:MAG: ribbon-helix-helix domain-containing protein [Actinomycetota bacterium]